jgi:hypothetical protein
MQPSDVDLHGDPDSVVGFDAEIKSSALDRIRRRLSAVVSMRIERN